MEDRIIVAKFGRGNTCRTAPQFRLNRGQILQFEGIELPALYQAHFSNSPYGQAKTVIGDSTGVQIPQEYFVPGKEIYVWIYVNTEDYGITKYQITIPVCPRADISDQVPDPEEQTVIDQAIALLNDTNEHVQDRIDASLAAAKASGEFDGVDGSTIWTYISTPITPNYTFYKYLLRGTSGAVPKVEDLIIMGNDMYKIASIGEYTVLADYYLRLKGTDGRDGVSPTMTVTKRTVEFGTVDRYIISITDTNGTREYNVDTPTALMINLIASECIERNIYTFNGLLDTDEPWSLYIRTGPSLSDDTFWDRVSHFSNPAMVTLVFNPWGVGLVDSPRIEAPLTSVAEAGDSRSLSFETLLYDDGRLVLIRLSINYNGEVQTTSVSHEYLETLLGTIPGVVYFDHEQELSDFEKSIARENIGAASIEDLGTVFDIKGEVATASDLPASGNRVGDVYYVVDQSVAYVWLETNEHPNGYWEEFGAPIDLSGYATKTELNNKVDKVTGKGLSTNDYSTAEKSKLASIAEGAQVNAIERIKKNGVALPINLKAVDITVPEKTSDLDNDSNFTSSLFVTYTVNVNTMAVTCDTDFDDIYAALEANHLVQFSLKYSDPVSSNTVAVWVGCTYSSVFINTIFTDGPGSFIRILHNDYPNDHTITGTQYDHSPINVITANNVHPVESGAVYDALLNKLDTTGNAYRALSIPIGKLDSTSTSTVMTATVPGITELRDGVCMWLENSIVTSAAGVTLEINNLGAKPIYSSVAIASAVSTTYNKNYTMLFVYNSSRVTGGCWDMVYGYDSNTSYSPAKLGQGYAVCSTAAATVAKTASISSYVLTTGGIVAIKFDNDVPADATLNITSKGAKAIYYRGAPITAGVIKAGDTVAMIYSTNYHVISIDRDEAPVSSVNGQTGAVTLSIPSTASDVGAVAANQGVANANKVLKVNSYGVVVPEDNRFVVTLTPTAQDYSGVMDKTVGEIEDAWAAGKRIVFKVVTGANSAYYVDCTMRNDYNSQSAYPYYGAYIIDDVTDVIICAFAGGSSDPNDNTYFTRTYPLATGQWTGGSY